MKEKTLMILLGVLVGTVITAMGFLIFDRGQTNNQDRPMVDNGQRQNNKELIQKQEKIEENKTDIEQTNSNINNAE